MRRQWLRQWIHCTSKVHHLKSLIKCYQDSRCYPRIQPRVIALNLIMGFLFHMRSLEQLESWNKEGVFKRIARGSRMPTVSTLRVSLHGVNLSRLEQINDHVVQNARKNKVLRGGTMDGWTVSALDGFELFDSVKKPSPEALTRTKDGTVHAFYRLVGCMGIGRKPRLVWGVEPVKARDGSEKDEGELTAGKRLMTSLHQRFHHFTDILVCDALYGNAPFMNSVSSLGIHLIVRMKNKRLNIVKDALGLMSKRRADQEWVAHQDSHQIQIRAWEEEMEMSGVSEPVRFVRFAEHIQTLHGGKVVKEEDKEVMIVTTCGTEVERHSLWKMIHHRWDIENSLFHQLKTYGALDHRFVDGMRAIHACVLFQMLAFNLWQLFLFRYLRNYDQKKEPQIRIAEKMLLTCRTVAGIPALLTPD